MIKEKVINNPKLLGVRIAKYLRVTIPFLGLDLIDPSLVKLFI